ncbi:kinesin motor domain-containing protein [Ditylenchus destructor]|uniref:Kinesin motor domain-containing protein n=1 Tax=Ditylenchus destructor TaxID=166010 RepID=A0AAD4NAL5_9BILA|nr:kinesin motor domain-containing protein [Ditylenchus destructor]
MKDHPVSSDMTFVSEKFDDGTETSKLKVFLRIRPNNEDGGGEFMKISDDQTSLTVAGDAHKSDMAFACDHIFDMNASQQAVYDKIAPELLSSFTQGRNVCIFAYGQTGSGKTHSILGTFSDLGLLPRFSNELVQKMGPAISQNNAALEVSFYEVYKEKVYDLLSNNRNAVRVRGTDKVYLEGLTTLLVESKEDVKKALITGLKKRSTSATLMNDVSSRSHAIFHIRLSKNQIEVLNTTQRKYVSTSDCYFVDLAGSEKGSAVGSDNIAETAAINCSLLALQKIIENKATNGGAYVNFRESVLTRLLKDCFGGNSKTALLATVASNPEHRAITLQTLRFSMNASKLKLISKENVDPFVEEIKQLKAKNELMEAELSKLRSDANIDNMSDVIEDVPCVVELLVDSSFVKPQTKLAAGTGNVKFGLVSENDAIVEFCTTKKSVHAKCLKNELTVNGDFVDPLNKVELKQGDRLALNGVRFFVFVTNIDTPLHDLSTYHQAKLEYVEKTYPLVEQKMREKAREEFEEDQNEMVKQLNRELESTKDELQRTQTLLGKTKSSSEKEKLKKRCSQLQDNLDETEQFRTNMLNKTMDQVTILEHPTELNKEQRVNLMQVHSNASAIKQMLDNIFKLNTVRCDEKHGCGSSKFYY